MDSSKSKSTILSPRVPKAGKPYDERHVRGYLFSPLNINKILNNSFIDCIKEKIDSGFIKTKNNATI